MIDRGREVRHELGARAHERAVVVGVRVVRLEDEPLEVVDVRVESVRPGPGHDLAGDVGPDRPVVQELAQAGSSPDPASPGSARPDSRRPGPTRSSSRRKPHGARDHPPGHDADEDATGQRRADRLARVGPDDQVVADERPVDIERDQLDGQDRLRGEGVGHPVMMPDRTPERPAAAQISSARSRRPAASRPGRARTEHVHPGSRRSQRSTISSP